jgi:hypothetical protein
MALVLEAVEGLKEQPERRAELKRQEESILEEAARAIGQARQAWAAGRSDARLGARPTPAAT